MNEQIISNQVFGFLMQDFHLDYVVISSQFEQKMSKLFTRVFENVYLQLKPENVANRRQQKNI